MIRALIWMIGGTLFLSALFAPPIYSGLKMFMGDSIWPFSRVFDRVAMVCIAALVLIFRKDFPLQPVKAFLSKARFSKEWSFIPIGIVLSLIFSMLLLPSMVDGVSLTWNPKTPSEIFIRILKVVPAALLISLLEEGFFRVLLFQRLLQGASTWLAMTVCSFVYALAHFITPAKAWLYPGWSIDIGFRYLVAVGERLFLPGVAEAFFGLFLVGLVLCFVIYRVRSLFLCIGLHAGWVIALKLSGFLTMKLPDFEYAAGVGRRYFLLMSPFTWISILLVGAVALGLGSLCKSRGLIGCSQ
ncbi:MAG: CPBP family intramembrane metalloprotease [Bdellovibrionales bacterium]|nr:CPBP family intramembrane metalloprotease [Bdellovibrionales bacterium]